MVLCGSERVWTFIAFIPAAECTVVDFVVCSIVSATVWEQFLGIHNHFLHASSQCATNCLLLKILWKNFLSDDWQVQHFIQLMARQGALEQHKILLTPFWTITTRRKKTIHNTEWLKILQIFLSFIFCLGAAKIGLLVENLDHNSDNLLYTSSDILLFFIFFKMIEWNVKICHKVANTIEKVGPPPYFRFSPNFPFSPPIFPVSSLFMTFSEDKIIKT